MEERGVHLKLSQHVREEMSSLTPREPIEGVRTATSQSILPLPDLSLQASSPG